ncbi:NAD-dependent epimerase/dehydratase family protein [Micromonospora sp. NPDC049662]|uniref:NAD-dependent epimerase/dehydratase family protein n=1 Tax=Micromonospora sp. NPDC049662 TaxID=3155397 RepID=UPI00342CBFE4
MAERALVTGGAGFVGLHLCRRLLAEGFDVVVVDNLSRHGRDRELDELLPHVQLVDHDLSRGMPASVPGRCSVVFHLAAWVGVDRVTAAPYRVLRDNIASTGAVLDWCTDHTVETVFLSSTSELGDGATELGLAGLPTPETAPFAVRAPHAARASYALSKLVAEALLLHHGGRRVRIGRYYNVYGPRMGYNHVIPQFIARVLDGVDPFPVYGGANTRSFCYVADALEATMRLVRLPQEQPIIANIGDDTAELAMTSLAEKLFEVAGVSPGLDVRRAPAGSPQRRVPDLSNLQMLTGYQPEVSLSEGLATTFRWYAERHREPSTARTTVSEERR